MTTCTGSKSATLLAESMPLQLPSAIQGSPDYRLPVARRAVFYDKFVGAQRTSYRDKYELCNVPHPSTRNVCLAIKPQLTCVRNAENQSILRFPSFPLTSAIKWRPYSFLLRHTRGFSSIFRSNMVQREPLPSVFCSPLSLLSQEWDHGQRSGHVVARAKSKQKCFIGSVSLGDQKTVWKNIM